jgi:hypothetical protein
LLLTIQASRTEKSGTENENNKFDADHMGLKYFTSSGSV